MKKKTSLKTLHVTVLSCLMVLSLLLVTVLFSLRLKRPLSDPILVWEALTFDGELYLTQGICLAFIAAFAIQFALTIYAICMLFKGRLTQGFFPTSLGLVLSLGMLMTHVFYQFFGTAGLVLLIINLILELGTLCWLLFLRATHHPAAAADEVPAKKIKVTDSIVAPPAKWCKIVLLILNVVGALALLLVFFLPLFTVTKESGTTVLTLIDALKAGGGLLLHLLFAIFLVLVLVGVVTSLFSIAHYFDSDGEFLSRTRFSNLLNLAVSFVFFGTGYGFTFYYNIVGHRATTLSYIPFLILLAVAVAAIIIAGKSNYRRANEGEKKSRVHHEFSLVPLIFVFAFTAITALMLVFNVIDVSYYSAVANISSHVKLTGYQLLTTYGDLGSGFQALAFVLFMFLFTSGALFLTTACSYFARYKDYYKVVKLSVITNVIFTFILGSVGIYFQIGQKINEDSILDLLAASGVDITLDYHYEIKAQIIIVFLISLALLLIMIATKQLNKSAAEPARQIAGGSALPPSETRGGDQEGQVADSTGEKVKEEDSDPLFDACPAFTELDGRKPSYEADLAERQKYAYAEPTLPSVVRFVVDYARECRLHLSYTTGDIATFIAGLGASRLAILQGMSGTGKTSLPKIFSEAIMGNCEIVEVESSWRDKNELLGYYNEFSRCFTPKKFTQSLYKARLNAGVPTFIVLDEMNLSRIEYYFSDFLSLMENEEDKRTIKLLNVKLFRTEGGTRSEYLGLEDGHTLRIPPNVWFIGTANRDESTFEISDKVYDRAQTMNFSKRAARITSNGKPLKARYLSYTALAELLQKAKDGDIFNAEENHLIQETEKILAPFNISYGNRVLKQMEEFVKVYCACFDDRAAVTNEAIEKILLSKVVSKLEYKNIEDKNALVQKFEALALHRCSAFVAKLNED